jgi:hypothetical protein
MLISILDGAPRDPQPTHKTPNTATQIIEMKLNLNIGFESIAGKESDPRLCGKLEVCEREAL